MIVDVGSRQSLRYFYYFSTIPRIRENTGNASKKSRIKRQPPHLNLRSDGILEFSCKVRCSQVHLSMCNVHRDARPLRRQLSRSLGNHRKQWWDRIVWGTIKRYGYSNSHKLYRLVMNTDPQKPNLSGWANCPRISYFILMSGDSSVVESNVVSCLITPKLLWAFQLSESKLMQVDTSSTS